MEFVWDAKKDRSNQAKHGLSFEDAVTVFNADEGVLRLYDEDHSEFEDRFISIDPIRGGLVLVVWTEIDDGIIRVISARWATPREQRLYHLQLEKSR